MDSQNYFEKLSEADQSRIERYVAGVLSEEEFDVFETDLQQRASLRQAYRQYVAIQAGIEEFAQQDMPKPAASPTGKQLRLTPSFALIGGALVLAIASVFFLLGRWQTPAVELAGVDEDREIFAEGFAVVESFNGVSPSHPALGKDSTLSNGVFTLEEGWCSIRFYSGAMMRVAAPASLTVQNAWEVSCERGDIDVHVPPAARGFVIHTSETKIVDLGTEFRLSVDSEASQLKVISGEVLVKHRDEDETLLTTGEGRHLPLNSNSEELTSFTENAILSEGFDPFSLTHERLSYHEWKREGRGLMNRQDVIAYYTFENGAADGVIEDFSLRGAQSSLSQDATEIGVETVPGRWPSYKTAKEFPSPGARARLHIDGEFSAMTFSAWVRINSLDRRYNALFMGDGYENGEPHWQIRDDGMLMLSFMVDTEAPTKKAKEGKHKVYFSPPIWNPSMTGRWIHLCSSFCPEKRLVCHYVNGEQVSSETIQDTYFIDALRIGSAEIGNWGLPFRRDPKFAIRNFNGRIGEMILFSRGLSASEVASLHRATSRKKMP